MSQIESAGPTALNPSSTGLPTLPKIHLETSVGQDQAQILDRTTNKPSDQETLEAMDALPPITDSASLASFDLRAASGDSGKTGRRRKSVLQSMLFSENLEAHRVISDKDHGLKSILDQQLSEMTRVFRLIKEKESGLGQEASSGAESASPLRKLTMELNKSTYAFQPPRVSQVAISKSSTVLDRPGSSRASFGARPISGQSPLWSLDQALKEAEAEDVNDASGIKKQLQKVLKDRNRVLDHWNLVKTQIQQAKSSAAEEEKLREQEALKGFSSLKFDSSMLPSIKVPLKLDNIDFEKFGLLSSPQNSNLEEEKEVPVDQKIKDLLNKIKQHDISRTDSRVKRVWFIDPKKKMIAMDQEGVLEAEADLVAAPHGALEIPKHGPVRKNVPYSPEAREILKRMNWRINYLKNPRFKLKPMEEQQATSVNLPQPSSAATTIRSYGTIQTEQLCLEHPELNVFAEPAAVVFSEYEAGKSYTKTLTIRNKSKHSHRFRICPLPAFEYPRNFTWTLSKSPVGDNGLVAPGMSLQYDVTFRPQSLVNETFLLQVFTEDGYSFKVPISAQRQSPALTLPDELHCGPCRAGFVAHKKWDFVNDGGPGKFILLSESETRDPWDIIRGMDEDVYSNSMVYKEGPFEISPAFFSVDSAEKKTLYVKYNAEEIKETTGLIKSDRRDTILIKIGCENGQILELPIVGMAQSSRLKISRAQTEDGTILQRNEILKTDKYDMVINYGNQNPHAVSTYLVAVKNLSKLKLPFRWVTYENQGEFATDVIPNQSDPDDSFQIIPSRGWLGPECETTFEINFSPETTRIYDVLAKLLLCNDTPRISASQAPMETEETALSLCCRGEGIVYDVAVSPPTINIPGVLHSTVTHMTQIRLHNHSVSKLAFEWLLEDMDEDVIDLEMSQTSGAISAGSVLLIDIKLTPKFPQKVSGRLVCSTGHGLGPQLIVPINAIVELKPGTLEFTKPMIDFGLLALGSMATAEVALVNHSTHAVAWAVQGHSRLTKDEDLDCVMTCEPSGGYLEASQSQTIKLQYTPLWYQSFRGLLNCQILGIWDKLPDMTVLHLPHCEPVSVAATRLKAEVQTPRLQCCNPVNVVSCFKDVPFIWTITLENMTMLETSYAWLECDEPDIEVVYLPKQGHIGGKEHREIRLQVTLKTVGEHKDLSFCCHVTDMVENNGLVRVKLEAYVRPVDVVVHVEGNRIKGEVNAEPQRYSTRKLAEDALTAIPHVSSGRKNLMFDFGSDCPVFGTRMRSLVVRNMTSATVPFQVLCEKFFARIEKASYSKRSFEGPDQGVEDTILKKTPRTRHGFSSKTGQSFVDNINKVREMMQEMHDILRDGRGAAFYPVPGQGTLGPWEEIKIDIMAYNNLVGEYDDVIHLQVGETIDESMPVHLRVIGTGVKFSGPQLVSNKKNVPNWIERINFGSRIINLEWQGGDGVKVGRNVSDSKTEPGRSFDLESFSKTVTVENQSPKTVTLQWRTYTHCKTDDAQLGAADVFAASDILNDDYLLQPDDSGIIEVIPKSMTIPAFKSVPLRVLFRSAVRGSYDALVMAEVGYSEPDGSLRFAPVLPTSKRYFKSLARLHVQAKVIEPHLSLDDGLKSIRIKKKLTAASQDGKSMGKVAGSRTVNVFLKNNSDAICLFYLEISPSDQFSIKTSRAKVVDTSEVNMSRARSSRGAGGGIHPEVERTFTGQPLYELKPTEQMLIAVTYQEKPGTPSETLRSDNPLIVGATEKGTSSSFVFDDSSTTATPPSTSSSNTRPTAQTSTMNPTEIEKQLKVTFTNGMVQSFPIIVETSYKVSPSQT